MGSALASITAPLAGEAEEIRTIGGSAVGETPTPVDVGMSPIRPSTAARLSEADAETTNLTPVRPPPVTNEDFDAQASALKKMVDAPPRNTKCKSCHQEKSSGKAHRSSGECAQFQTRRHLLFILEHAKDYAGEIARGVDVEAIELLGDGKKAEKMAYLALINALSLLPDSDDDSSSDGEDAPYENLIRDGCQGLAGALLNIVRIHFDNPASPAEKKWMYKLFLVLIGTYEMVLAAHDYDAAEKLSRESTPKADGSRVTFCPFCEETNEEHIAACVENSKKMFEMLNAATHGEVLKPGTQNEITVPVLTHLSFEILNVMTKLVNGAQSEEEFKALFAIQLQYYRLLAQEQSMWRALGEVDRELGF